MKKIVFLVLSIFIIFISCKTSSTTINFNETLPIDKITKIHWFMQSSMSIIEYNGFPVNWKNSVKGTMPTLMISIPGGNTKFILDGFALHSSLSVIYNEVPFSYYFQNGKEYTVLINLYIISIYDGIYENKFPRKKNLIARYDMRNGQKLIE